MVHIMVKLTNQMADIGSVTSPWYKLGPGLNTHDMGHSGMFGSCQSLDQKQLDKGINYPFISRDESRVGWRAPGDTDLKNCWGQDVVN